MSVCLPARSVLLFVQWKLELSKGHCLHGVIYGTLAIVEQALLPLRYALVLIYID